MKSKEKNREFIKPSEELRESKKFTIRDIIGGEILTKNFMVKQLPFFLFIALLLLTYIANRNGAEKTARRMVEMQKNIKELRSQSISVNFKLMNLSKQSAIVKNLKDRGMDLKESTVPPKIILNEK